MPSPTTSTQTRPRSAGYAVRLDELYLRLAPGPGRVFEQSFDRLQAGRVDTSSNAEELVTEFGQVYARDDFTGGEGLDRAHRRDGEPSDFTRYWASAGVDIQQSKGGRPARLALLHAGERIYSAASLGSPVAFDGNLFARTSADVTQLVEVDDPTGSPSSTTISPHNGEATSATTAVSDPVVLGGFLYVGLGTNGVHRRAVGATSWAHWSDVRVDRLWAVKNRIVGSYQGTLYEVRAAAASVTLFTLGSGTSGRWDAVADAGPVILAAGSSVGTTSSVLHAFEPDASGELVIAAQSAQPEREMVAAIATVYGRVFFTTVPDVTGTAPGKLWVGGLSEAGTLTDIQLLKDFSVLPGLYDEASSGRKLTADGTNVYVGALDATTLRPRLWRVDATTLGVHRFTDFPDAGSSSATYPPHPLFALGRLFLADAGGLHRVSDTEYVSSGYLISPLADFGTATPKEWVAATLKAEQIEAGTEAELYYTVDPAALLDPDHVSWRRVKRLTTGTDDRETPIAGATGSELAAMIRLVSDDTDETPGVRGFSFRGFPGGSDVLLDLPIDVSDLLDRPGKAATRVRGRGKRLYATLLDRQGDDAVLELLDLDITLRGLIENVSAPISTRSTRGAQTFHCMLGFRGRTVSGAGDADPPLTGTLGTATLGMLPAIGSTS